MTLRVLLLSSLSALPCSAQLPPKPPPPGPVDSGTPTTPAAPRPLSKEARAQLEKQLTTLAEELDKAKYGYLAKVIAQLREAGASSDKALHLWMDAVQEIEFDQKGKTMAEFAEWKRRQTKDANPERDLMLQLEVQWLAIVLMEVHARTDAARAEVVQEAYSYLDKLVAASKKTDGYVEDTTLAKRNKNRKPAAGDEQQQQDPAAFGSGYGAAISKKLKLDAAMPIREGAGSGAGSATATEVGSIYGQFIMPYFRDRKLAGPLMAAWKKRIEHETAMASAKRFNEAKEKFTAEVLPQLKWEEAVDLFDLGQETIAAQNMVAVIRANQAHKNAASWIAALKAMLKIPEKVPGTSAPPAVPEKPAPASAPAPASGGP